MFETNPGSISPSRLFAIIAARWLREERHSQHDAPGQVSRHPQSLSGPARESSLAAVCRCFSAVIRDFLFSPLLCWIFRLISSIIINGLPEIPLLLKNSGITAGEQRR
ncbi:hypothetical protein ABC974_07865 [Sphingomonas oligophenolica]|uniref:Uncharacterized protein n=1 Tax=Sphingomonas oligophenolica TaxID=301154 RepID=A0ABU9Y147_9SPHN